MLTKWEILILSKLIIGYTKRETSDYLKNEEIEPFSDVSIERSLKKLQIQFESPKTHSLIYKMAKKGKLNDIFLKDILSIIEPKTHTELELIILKKISEGLDFFRIPSYLEQNDQKPISLSSIEKKVNKIKKAYNAKNLNMLMYIIAKKEILKK